MFFYFILLILYAVLSVGTIGKIRFLNRISRLMGLNIHGIGLPLPQAVPASVWFG
jgi:hypothetical protein